VYDRVFSGAEQFSFWEAGNVFGRLDTALETPWADGFLNLRFDTDKRLVVDEAYVRFSAGSVDVEGGLRKITWGRADSFGPLDVVNPVDYSDLTTMGDIKGMKIARPLLRVSWRFGSFSRLEGVFVPWFRGNEYALRGRWAPVQIAGLAPSLAAGLRAQITAQGVPDLPADQAGSGLDAWRDRFNIDDYYKSRRESPDYAQGGLRFTTTLGDADLGVQYYFGRLPRPAYTVDVSGYTNGILPWVLGGGAAPAPDPDKIGVHVDYNYYHHIGVDYAQVLGGFNIRAEAGVNLTKDTKGDDGAVYNPAVVYSLGFDRNLVWGVNLNLQGNGSIRLMHDNIGGDPLSDIEGGKDITSTRITAILSKKFFRDELELKATTLWGIEDRDFLVIPAIIWSKYDIKAELSAGIFGGSRDGELGQYRDNSYIKTAVSWSF
jgi:hypothetical protein